MSRNFKTTKNYKVVCDYMDWYYTWKDLRERFALDDLEGYIVLNGRYCDLKDIRDIDLDDEGMEYLLRLHSHTDTDKDKYDEKDLEYLNSRYGYLENDYEIRPFYISYYGSGAYRVQFCMGEEGQGLMLIKRRENRDEMDNAEKITKKVFEHYIQGEFLYVQIYSPHNAYFEEGEFRSQNGITFWDYEDGGIYYMDEDEALSTIPDYAGEIIRETESMDLEVFELIPKKTDNQ